MRQDQSAAMRLSKRYTFQCFSTRLFFSWRVEFLPQFVRKRLCCCHKIVTDLSQMMVSLDQAIEIHARVLIFRAGQSAQKRAKDAALSCKTRGDLWGHDVWMKVATTIDELKSKPESAPRPLA